MNNISIHNILKNLNIELNDEANNLLKSFKDKDDYLQKFVKLLLSIDLTMIIKKGSFPIDIQSQHKTNLKGIHLVQLLEAEDITKANEKNRFYFNSDNFNMKNISINHPTKNRMLKFVFTDGSNLCTAIEYKYMPELDEFVDYWCEFTKLKNFDLNVKNIHILAFLSGEPIIRRGVILLLPGNLTFIRYNNGKIKDEKKTNETIKSKKKNNKTFKDTIDIRSYSNFIISVDKKIDSENKSKSNMELPDIRYSELNALEKNSETENLYYSESSSIIEIVDDLEIKEDIDDIEFIEDIEFTNVNDFEDNQILSNNQVFSDNQDMGNVQFKQDSFSYLNKDPLDSYSKSCDFDQKDQDDTIWVEAAVLNSKIGNKKDEIILEIGVHYPEVLLPPWDKFLFNEIVLSKEVANKIMCINIDFNEDLFMDYLLVYVRFIQGKMCFKAITDDKYLNSNIKIHLIGFIPYSNDSELLLSLLDISENSLMKMKI